LKPAAFADYAPTAPPGLQGALIAQVNAGSPADNVGLVAGMRVLAAEGATLRDILDWLWLTDDEEVRLTVAGAEAREYVLTRSYGEDWGITFADPLFDGLMTCCNSCLFCFMAMLPKGMRRSLYVRDDDYRLSFLQGNFVTLTNLDETDVQRIIDYRLSPLHVSLHAITPTVRQRLMGDNHERGVEVLEQLLVAGLEVHAQMVLVPGINDGAELDVTLTWIEGRPNILSVGIVPYGFTRYARLQTPFTSDDAQRVIAQVLSFQERSRAQEGKTRFQLADEWYLLADVSPPSAECYDGYPQFEDGIGMLRAFEDEWETVDFAALLRPVPSPQSTCSASPVTPAVPACPAPSPHLHSQDVLVTGEAFAPMLKRLLNRRFAQKPPEVRAIRNQFFGGNVSVAGLLTAQDIIAQLKEQGIPAGGSVVVPSIIFNADGLTLDDKTVEDIARAVDRRVIVVPCTVPL
jgi:putative radical SAM enzyme (TIGR03279 family)